MSSKVLAAVSAVASFAILGVACKKNVEPSTVDAGAAPVVTAVAAPTTEVDAALPALSATAVVKPVAKKDGGADAKADAVAVVDAAPVAVVDAAPPPPPTPATPAPPAALSKATIASCANARIFCKSPKLGTDPKIKAQCDQFTADCKAGGGTL